MWRIVYRILFPLCALYQKSGTFVTFKQLAHDATLQPPLKDIPSTSFLIFGSWPPKERRWGLDILFLVVLQKLSLGQGPTGASTTSKTTIRVFTLWKNGGAWTDVEKTRAEKLKWSVILAACGLETLNEQVCGQSTLTPAVPSSGGQGLWVLGGSLHQATI